MSEFRMYPVDVYLNDFDWFISFVVVLGLHVVGCTDARDAGVSRRPHSGVL